jgi:hypothetical protein
VGGLGNVDIPKTTVLMFPSGHREIIGGPRNHGLILNLHIPNLYECEMEKPFLNKLRKKAGQYRLDKPYIIAIKFSTHPASNAINSDIDQALSIIEGQDDFDWISAVIKIIPRTGFAPRDHSTGLILTENTKARHPIDVDAFVRGRPAMTREPTLDSGPRPV